MSLNEECVNGVHSGHLPLRNLMSYDNDCFIVLRHSAELDFGQGRVSMACICSTMSLSEASAGNAGSSGKESNR